MGDLLRAWIEEDHIFDALLQIKGRANLGILLLVVFAQNLNDGLRNFFKRFIGIRRLFAENRNVRTS